MCVLWSACRLAWGVRAYVCGDTRLCSLSSGEREVGKAYLKKPRERELRGNSEKLLTGEWGVRACVGTHVCVLSLVLAFSSPAPGP